MFIRDRRWGWRTLRLQHLRFKHVFSFRLIDCISICAQSKSTNTINQCWYQWCVLSQDEEKKLSVAQLYGSLLNVNSYEYMIGIHVGKYHNHTKSLHHGSCRRFFIVCDVSIHVKTWRCKFLLILEVNDACWLIISFVEMEI